MSTRANIIIAKASESGVCFSQMYRHSDGYPDGLGLELTDAMLKISSNDALSKLNTTKDLANYLDDMFVAEHEMDGECICLHGDIDYLYTVNLTTDTIGCYNVYDAESDITENMILADNITVGGVKEVYKCNIFDTWEEIEKKL